MADILSNYYMHVDVTNNSPPPPYVSPDNSSRRTISMEEIQRPTLATGSCRLHRLRVGNYFIMIPDVPIPHQFDEKFVEEKLVEMQALDADWDGYGALPTSQTACDLARKFTKILPASIVDYEIYPEPDGSVGWECHNESGFSLYISFLPDDEIAYVAAYRNDGHEEIHRGRGIKLLDALSEVLQRFIDELVEPLAAISNDRYFQSDPRGKPSQGRGR